MLAPTFFIGFHFGKCFIVSAGITGFPRDPANVFDVPANGLAHASLTNQIALLLPISDPIATVHRVTLRLPMVFRTHLYGGKIIPHLGRKATLWRNMM